MGTPAKAQEYAPSWVELRLYAEPDYVARLEEAGFSVRADNAVTLLGARAVKVYALEPEEKVFVCSPE